MTQFTLRRSETGCGGEGWLLKRVMPSCLLKLDSRDARCQQIKRIFFQKKRKTRSKRHLKKDDLEHKGFLFRVA